MVDWGKNDEPMSDFGAGDTVVAEPADTWDYVLANGGKLRETIPFPARPAYDNLLSTVQKPQEFEDQLTASLYLSSTMRIPTEPAFDLQESMARNLFRRPMSPGQIVSRAMQDEKLLGRAITAWNSLMYQQKLNEPPSWWQQRYNAWVRGWASMGSSMARLAATVEGSQQPGYGPQFLMPEQRAELSQKDKETSRVLWQVAQSPELAARSDDAAGKLLDLVIENAPYLLSTTAAYTTMGPAGGFVVGGAGESNSTYQRAIDKGVPEEKARQLAGADFLIAGAIESFGGPAADKLMTLATEKIANRIVRGGADLTIGSIIEALEEGGQGLTEESLRTFYEKVDWNEALRSVLGQMGGGFALGGMFHTTSAVMRGVTNFRAPAEQRSALRFLAAQGELNEQVVSDLEQMTAEAQNEEAQAQKAPGTVQAGTVAETAAVAPGAQAAAEGTAETITGPSGQTTVQGGQPQGGPALPETEAVAAKEPWEMNKAEFFPMPADSSAIRSKEGRIFTGETHSLAYIALVDAGDTFSDAIADTGWFVNGRYYPDNPDNRLEPHAEIIRTAYEEGKPVRREVVEEYKGKPWADKILAEMDAKAKAGPDQAVAQSILSAVKTKELVPADYVAEKENKQALYDAASWLIDESDGWLRLPKTQQQKIKRIRDEAQKQGATPPATQKPSAGPKAPEEGQQPPAPAEIVPPAKPGATVEAAGEPPQVTSARQAMLEDDYRAITGREGVNSKEKQSMQQWHDEALAQGIPEQALRIGAEVLAKSRLLSPTETAGLVVKLAQVKKDHISAMTQIGQSRDAATTADLSARIGTIEGEFETLYQALYRNGSEAGRRLASQKLTINQDFSLVAVKARAKAAKGVELSAQEIAKLEELTAKLADQTAKVETLEKELNKLKAEQMLKRLKGAQKYAAMTAEQKSADRQAKIQKVTELMKAGCY